MRSHRARIRAIPATPSRLVIPLWPRVNRRRDCPDLDRFRFRSLNRRIRLPFRSRLFTPLVYENSLGFPGRTAVVNTGATRSEDLDEFVHQVDEVTDFLHVNELLV